MLFTTYERDAESGNDYAMARSYVNRLGRFSSLDPLGGSVADPQTLSRYTYTRNDPIGFVDPSGRLMVINPCDPVTGINCSQPISPPAVDCGFGFPDPRRCNPSLFDPISVKGDPTAPGGGGGFFGGAMDVSRLRQQALVALLNPNCAELFGGFSNAVASLFNSSYNWYVPGQANPFPNQISSALWRLTVSVFQSPSTLGVTEPNYAPGTPSGRIIFFQHQFSSLNPGFGTGSQEYQMTAFMHEQEHAANHYEALDRAIDSNYPLDFQKINSRCKPQSIEQESALISGQLTPP